MPKQFCSLAGGPTLLADAVERAGFVAPRERTCIVVGKQHQRYWRGAARPPGARYLIEQPRNCGTGVGILLAVLQILRRDPAARIVFLPADHYVRDEAALGASLREAVRLVAGSDGGLVLVGIEPEGGDPDLGYIVPGDPGPSGAFTVRRFVEKPDASQARTLLSSGAVWNSFIFAADGTTLRGMLRARLPWIAAAMWGALERDGRQGGDQRTLRALYETLPTVDFCRSVLQGNEAMLQLLTAPACGWNDLGTPHRLTRVLAGLTGRRRPRPQRQLASGFTGLNLAAQCGQLTASGWLH